MPAHPHRLPASESTGFQQTFLTLCTYRRQKLFVRGELVQQVEWQFLQSSGPAAFEILAYCFMPDHVHLLLDARSESSDLCVFVKAAKQVTAFHAKKVFGLRLWQDSFFDRTLRASETLPSVIRYIVNNPVRAGLVQSPEEYSLWGSQVYTREEILEFVQFSDPRA